MMITEIEKTCNERGCFPECEKECGKYPKGCQDIWIEERWSEGDPCPKCGIHSRLLIKLDGSEEITPCNCAEEKE